MGMNDGKGAEDGDGYEDALGGLVMADISSGFSAAFFA